MFCKILDCEVNGQILIKIDTNDDDKPEVRVYFEPADLGVCSIAFSFDGDDAWDKADKAFKNMKVEDISHVISETLKGLM